MSVTASWAGGGTGFSVLVHGGAGDVPENKRAGHAEGCRRAAEAARALLHAGKSALDAVERAVVALEDDPRFNAGTGACLTSEGTLELDAALMEGSGLRAGAVAALPPFKNPIAIARAALEDGRHVLYAGLGAAEFARRAGFVPAHPASMITEHARAALEHALRSGRAEGWAGGTVGAVARDRAGNVAAATSTGGMVGKRPGRIGDTPVLGAGTYADERSGAASATGNGEGILRTVLSAAALAALSRGASPEAAACEVLRMLCERAGATGGIILVDREGRLGLARSTQTMSWGAAWEGTATISGF